jgi:NPCBM/NEW2 domain/Secretion system C-terminal sorting domain
MTQWNNTYFDSHLKKTLQMYGGAFGAKAVLWQQGENETEIKRQAPGSYDLMANYETPFKNLIDKSRAQAINNIPWVISKKSYMVSVGNSNAAGLVSSNLTQTSTVGATHKNFFPDLINKQNTILGTKPFLYAGPLTEPISGIGTGDLDERYRGPGQRLHFDGVQGAGGKNGLELLAEKWYNSVINMPVANNAVSQLANKIIVSKINGQYELTLANPDGVAITTGNFYWVVNDGGIDSKIIDPNLVPLPHKYKIPTNVSQEYYVTCYHQSNTSQVLTPSQPYLVKANCNNCRIGVGSSSAVSIDTKNVPSGGNTEIVSFSNIGENFNGRIRYCLPAWITMSLNSNNQLEIITQPNNTGATRSETIIIEDYSGTAYLTIPISQVSTSSGCTATSLLSRPVTAFTGNWTTNVTTINTTPVINAVSFPNGGAGGSLSALSDCTRRFNLGGGYVSFSGKVGRDDSQDGCNCAAMDMGFQIINLDNNQVLFNSVWHGINTPAEAFNVPVTGVQNIELRTLLGTDGWNWGDLGNWVELNLNCSTPPTCNVQAPNNPTASANNVPPSTSVTLSTTCPSGTPVWSTGGTGNTVVVNPASTTAYTVLCNNGTNCNSTSVGITITVVTAGACSAVVDNLVMGSWNGNQLVARNFGSQFWLTQRVTASPEQFAVRASQMLQRGDVALSNPTYSSLIGCFAYQYSAYGGLQTPSNSQFPTPSGFTQIFFADGTPNYLQNSPTSGNPPNYNGFLDFANCNIIGGWAWDAANQSNRKTIEIIVNGAVVATGLANQYDSNLQAWGYNDGLYKFSIPTPASLKNGGTHSITARVQGSSFMLNMSGGTPKTISGCYSMNARAAIDETRNSDEIINGLVVSPNPSDGLYNLNFSTTMGSSVALMVTNLSGSVVLQQDFKAASATVNHVINLRSKPNGEYLISITTEGKRLIQKVVKIE